MFPSAWIHVVKSIISKRSKPRHPRIVLNLAVIYLEVIIIPTSLVTVSETKEDSPMNIMRLTH